MLVDGSRHEVLVMKLIEVIIKEMDRDYRFVFEGKMEEDSDETIGYSFRDLKVYEMVDGKKVPFEISGETWAGSDIDEDYAFAEVLSRYTRAATSAVFEYVAPELEEALKPYVTDMGLSAVHRISPKVLYGSLIEEYVAILVTDVYSYYHLGGTEYLMLDTNTGEVVANNFFAESGYMDSEEDVKTGKEVLLYQEYEFSIEDYVKSILFMVREDEMTDFDYRCVYGDCGECEAVTIKGTVNDELATFEIARITSDGHPCSSIPVFEMPLTNKAIEQVAELAKEDL